MKANSSLEPPTSPEDLVPRIGDYLVEQGFITVDQLSHALERQTDLREQGVRQLIGNILVEMGLIDKGLLDKAVTEQILQLRLALEENNQNLELRVDQRTRELKAALDKLSELAKLKGNFIANISHELRTPLTHLTGYIELLSGQDLGPLNPEQLYAIQVIQRSVDRLDRLIHDLLQFSFLESGDIQVMLQPVDFSLVCRSPIDQAQRLADEKEITFTVQAPGKLPVVLVDSEKISWAISQLLDNAIKFTPPGGSVSLSVEENDGYLKVTVADNGIGIPSDRFQEVFEAFHQLDGSSTRKHSGTGLGLTLAQKIIEAHNSTINIESETGIGSRFSFLLTIFQNTI